MANTKIKNYLQQIWDFIGIPFRLLLFDQKWLPKFGWTTLDEARFNAVLPYVKGRLLDIGCGTNDLVRLYGDGVGVDVFDWGGGSIIVEDTSKLPFKDDSFDTIAFLACLNHIPNRLDVLRESYRLIKHDGKIIITMINPILGGIGHALWWYSEDKHRGGMREGEVGGLWGKDIIKMCNAVGLAIESHIRFVYGMNNIYIFKKNKE